MTDPVPHVTPPPIPAPGGQDRALGDIVSEVTEKATLLIHEEIELAKAEVTTQLTRLGKGAVIGAIGGIFAVFGLVYLFFGLAFFLHEELDFSIWGGFVVVWGGLTLLGALAAFIAYRLFKKGSPPTPKMAIEEARITREVLEEARH